MKGKKTCGNPMPKSKRRCAMAVSCSSAVGEKGPRELKAWQSEQSIRNEASQGTPPGKQNRDDPLIQKAEETLKRSYLAMETENDPESLVASLSSMQAEFMPDSRVTARVLVVLDGSTEYARDHFRKHENNCVKPERIVEAKDGRFYDLLCHSFSPRGGTVLDRTDSNEHEYCAHFRRYQDGGAVAFANQNGVRGSLAAALEMHRALTIVNDKENLPWPERLHARIVIGVSWKYVVSSLRRAWSGETVVDPAIIYSLDESLVDLLLAVGVRIGPRIGVEQKTVGPHVR
jgi:hypothetical protein